MTTSLNQNNIKKHHFIHNANFQSFQLFKLKTSDHTLINYLDLSNLQIHPNNSHYQSQKLSQPNKHSNQYNNQYQLKKVKALISGCFKRRDKLLYKSQKYFIQDLQLILNLYPQTSPSIFKSFNITLNKSHNKVLVQCHNCANYTQVWKYCPSCEDVHYCHEGCQMKMKFTHQRQQCKLRSFPMVYKPLQVQIHIGSDLAHNVNLCFEHQVSMSLLMRGQKLLQQITNHFTNTAQGKAILDIYQIKNDDKMLKFQKAITNNTTNEQKKQIVIQKIEDIIKLYESNKLIHGIELYLLQNGGIIQKIVKQIHDNHFRQIFIYRYP